MEGYLPPAYVYGLEVVIKNPKKKYQDKVSALLSGWERLASLSNASPGSVNSLAECLYRDTLTLVLKGHWPKLSPATKTHLSVILQRCVGSLISHSALKKCRDLIGLVNNPWGHPTLTGILNNQESVNDSDVLEFCLAEKESMIFIRLETLCDSKCEDLALKLARACVQCLRSSDTRFHDACTKDEHYYILDLYIFLLYKFKNVQEIINELKHLDLKEGLALIRRYSAEKVITNLPRVYRNSHKVAELAAQYFLAVAMVKSVAETVGLLKDLMTEWVILHCRDEAISENLANMIRKLIQPAESALHVYIFIEVLVDKFGYRLKSLCIELYIRGLAMDMNELEHQKVVGDEEKVKETEVRLSYGFLKLADLLKDNLGVSRECLLTAFSLYPTDKTYQQLREMAIASGKLSSSPVITRKRKTKFIPPRVREERTCRSVYRKKQKVIESDSNGVSPVSSNSSVKKYRAEASSGDVPKFIRTVCKSPSKLSAHEGKDFDPKKYQKKGEHAIHRDGDFLMSPARRGIGKSKFEVSRRASQTDLPLSVSAACVDRHCGSRDEGLVLAGASAIQKAMPLDVNPNIRSRSGSFTETETDILPSADVDSSLRSRSRRVDKMIESEKVLTKPVICRSRFRSGDDTSSSVELCAVDSPNTCNSMTQMHNNKCYCEDCGDIGNENSSVFRRSMSCDTPRNSQHGPSSLELNPEQRAISTELFLISSQKSNFILAKELQMCSSGPPPKCSVYEIPVSSKAVAPVTRLRSRHGSASSDDSFFKEAKARQTRLYSGANSVSDKANGVNDTKYKTLVSLDIAVKANSTESEGLNHEERCKASHASGCYGNELPMGVNQKPQSCSDNFNVTADNEYPCKVCSHPHQDSINKLSNQKSSICVHTTDITGTDMLGHPSQLTESGNSSLNYDVLSAPNEVLDAEKLGLTSQLCDDLAVVLSGPRWHMLSWVLEWNHLSSLCERYLQDREGMRNITKELKYLNIDYNQFKDRPSTIDSRDEYSGIEKGYEQWADVSSEHSDSEYAYSPGHKKSDSTQCHGESDSDSSEMSQNQKNSLLSPNSSQSDSDTKEKKRRKQTFRTLSISDSDTGTQDSRAESLGSDGCYKETPKRKVPECRRKKIPLVKRIAEKRLIDRSKITLIVNEDICKTSHDPRDIPNDTKEVMTILSELEASGRKSSSKQYKHGSYSASAVNLLNTPERRERDSKTLKSLRMFRPNHLKSIHDRICFSSANESSKLKGKSHEESIKFAPMLSTLNLNPRILLTRADVSSHYVKSKNFSPIIVKNASLNAQQSTKAHGITRSSQCLREKKCIFSSSRKTNFSKSQRVLKKLNGLGPDFEMITQVMESQLLARTVPGLNSLDMMVPPPSEPTVQVIQLPHNPPSSTSGTHSSGSVNNPQKVTTTQGVQTSPPVIPQKNTATQGVQTSPVNAPKSTFTQGVQISPPSQSSVTGEPGPSSVTHGDEHWQSSRIVTTSENLTSHNVPTFTSSSSQVEPPFLGVGMETRYFTPACISSSVNTGTPVTAHIQRVGQPPVGLDGDSVLATPLRRLNQCPPQLLSSTHIPIVKGVRLDIVANIRAEALRSSDLGESFSAVIGMQHDIQVAGSHDTQKANVISTKDGKTCNLTSSGTQASPEDKLKMPRAQKVDEDSQTEDVHSTGACSKEGESGSILLLEDGVPKFISAERKQQFLKAMKSCASQVASLPKFQQAFGKTIYSSNPAGGGDSSSITQNTNIQDGSGCVHQGAAIAAEKLEAPASSGTVSSKGVQTSNLQVSSPSKKCAGTTSTSPLPDAKKPGLTEVSQQVPVLRPIQGVSSVATQSDPPVAAGPVTPKFSPAVSSGQSACQTSAVNSDTSPNAQKIPLVTSSQTIGALCEAHQSNEQEIAIPMKHDMVPLTANVNDKELILRNKMSDLLSQALRRNMAAANCPTSESTSTDVTVPVVMKEKKREGYTSSGCEDLGSDSMESTNDQEDSRIRSSENVRCVIQSPRVRRPIVEIPVEENAVSSVGSHGVALQSTLRSQPSASGHVPSVLCSSSSNNSVVTSHVSPNVDAGSSLITHNTIHPTVSSTTLEQLREFESVLEQVTNTSQMKERKSGLPQSENETANDLTQQLLLSQTSTPTNSTDFESSNTPSTSFSRESFPSSPPTTPPKGSSANFGGQTSGMQGSTSRITSSTPVVVVTTYSQPVASPSLSVTSQSSSSPNVTPTSTPGKTPPKSSPKSSKSKSMKAAPTTTSKTTPVTKPQQKPQEDEETAQRIYAILDQYAEQLKNSPDLINKPAPRRRSNPPINPIGSSKRKKSTPTKLRLSGHPPVLTESSQGGEDPRTAGSEDSSNGITQLPQVHDSPATIPSNSEDTSAHESPQTFQIRRGLSQSTESSEAREVNRASRGTETSSTLSSITATSDAATPESGSGGAVPISNAAPSSTGAVVAGKSLVVGSATALPLYVPGGVRQVLFPVASGLTASMQGRPVVVTKGSKVIRVHQVTVAGGTPMLAGAVAGAKPIQVNANPGAVQGALVVRQMCVNKAMVSTPSVSAPQMSPLTMVGATSTVKQLKLPVMQAVTGGISSQTLAGVTAQPPVVLPSGSHTLAAASFLPPNIKTPQGTSESGKESVGTSTVEDNIAASVVDTKVNVKPETVSTKSEHEELIAGSLMSVNPESGGEAPGFIQSDCASPVDTKVKKSVGCETDPQDDASQSHGTSIKSLPQGSCSINKIEVDSKEQSADIKVKINFEDQIQSGVSLEQPLKKITEETAAINPPPTVLVPHFHETVLVDALTGKVPQRNSKDDALSVYQRIDNLASWKAGIMGVSKTYIEPSKDSGSRSNPEQSIIVGSSVIRKDSSTEMDRTSEISGNIQPSINTSVGSATECNRGPCSSQAGITTSTATQTLFLFGCGQQGTPYLAKDSQERIHLHHSPGSSSSFNREKKKPDFPLEGPMLHESLPQEKGVVSTEKEKLPPNQSKSINDNSSLENAIDVGKSLVMDVSVPSEIPKELVPCNESSKSISPENKSCEERSSEDEERKLARTLTATNSSEYCFPVKRAQGDGKTSDSPWRYVPVVKRVSVSQGKAVPVDSALLRTHVESEACLNLPRITDSLPDELKEGESDDSCRPNFTPSIEATHSVTKRRLFSDDVLEYSTYPTAKKPEKKQRVEKINRVPDAIEREFRQTRLELEKELRLQKSLSEECEDLGVDEPSTSDLFPEADLLLDPNPSPTYDQTMPDTSCAQNIDSSEPFSSSDFRSVDSSSSAEGVHESAGCSKTLTLPGSKTVVRKEKPTPPKPRKYLLRHRGDKKKWMSVRNHHGTLEYRKVTKEDEKRNPILQRSARGNVGDLGKGSLNGSKSLPQSNVNVTFSSSSGEDSLSQHPAEGAIHTTTPTFSSDMTYSSPQDDTAASPNSPSSQTHEISPAPTAAQKFNITYGKKCQTYGKEYCRRGSKRSRVCRFINYLCDQGDSRDTCDSWESSNSVEKESTSESSKCGRTYGMMKETQSPSTSPEDDDDGKSIPDFQETTANHSFSNLLPLGATSKLPKDNMDDPVIEGIEDDNAILPPVNGIESDEEKNTQKRNSLGKSLRKHVMEKNAKKILDKIDLYPRVCLKKWKGKDSITCSRYALELENVSAMPTGSKHFTCMDRPLLESESSVSSEPSSENSSKTSIEQNISVGHLGLSKSLVLGKDGELNLQSECPNASELMKASLRRSSLRGHVKKGCPCCNGSPEPKKARVFKGEKLSKKGHSGKPCTKLHITKKR
ncbi:platelet binding protein GspB-like isoform X2 [Hetaerina americana]|uniref:platelet binding protein GspB-like isoform X2 n=1 Tax=Hetaerina americana TaxID=62018 RepID=UPI003A7F50A8